MRRKKTSQIVAFTAMIVAIICLAIGFSIFQKNLTIAESTAKVKANETNFGVKFSKSSTKLDESDITPYSTWGISGTYLAAHIDNSGTNPKLTNLGSDNTNFVADKDNTDGNPNGGYIRYELYVINDGEYDAYLKNIKIENVPGYTKPIVCIASEGTSQESVDEACKYLNVNVYINYRTDDEKYFNRALQVTTEKIIHGDATPYDSLGNYMGVTGMKLEKLGTSKYPFHKLSVYLGVTEYGNGPAAMAVDGPYNVKIGDITLEYSTQD